jgi:hypothetical protein
MTAVPFDGRDGEPAIGRPQTLFADEYDFGTGLTLPNYDVTSEGRFLMQHRDAQGGHLEIVFNWTEELKRAMAKRANP